MSGALSEVMSRWVKFRRPPSPYPKTEQQKKIAAAGERIREECSGKKGDEFYTCRSDVLREAFKKPEEQPEEPTTD